jgi:hypothetical protein
VRVVAGVYLSLGDFRPQVFQVIEFAPLLDKDMDNQGIVIHQYPLSFFKAFNPQRLNSRLGQGFLHVLSQGRDVPVGPAGAEDEEVRKRTKFGHLQEHRFYTLVGDEGLNGQIDQCCGGERG